MRAVIEMKLGTIVAILIVLAVVILALAIAAGALGPIEELTSKANIMNILRIFGMGAG